MTIHRYSSPIFKAVLRLRSYLSQVTGTLKRVREDFPKQEALNRVIETLGLKNRAFAMRGMGKVQALLGGSGSRPDRRSWLVAPKRDEIRSHRPMSQRGIACRDSP